jgi:hypothetical protein
MELLRRALYLAVNKCLVEKVNLFPLGCSLLQVAMFRIMKRSDSNCLGIPTTIKSLRNSASIKIVTRPNTQEKGRRISV